MKHGFVYILANVAMPELYKIGMTVNSPFARAEQLSTSTGVPMPFAVVAFSCSDDPAAMERRLHSRFSQFRCHGREFFRCKLSSLLDALREEDGHFCDIESAPWIYDEEPEYFGFAAKPSKAKATEL